MTQLRKRKSNDSLRSYSDLSDDEEGEYTKIMHSSSGRGVKLLFSKSKVYVHPTTSSKDNIAGFAALVQAKPSASSETDRPTTSSSSKSSSKASSYLLSWSPETTLGETQALYHRVESTDGESPPKRTPLVPSPPTTSRPHSVPGSYAFAVPLSEIYSLLIRPPSIGWWYGSVVINTRGGESFPALFFHDDECQSTILQRKRLVKESFDPFDNHGATFWGGDEILRWIKRYINVERSTADPSVYLVDPSNTDKLGFASPRLGPSATTSKSIPSTRKPDPKANGDAQMDALTSALKQASWGFLEKMSQVTGFARRTAQELSENRNIPPQVRRLMKNPEVQTLQEEFDSARVYLARWALGIQEQSERDRRERIWTARDVLETEESNVGEFEILDGGEIKSAVNRNPVTIEEWKGFFHERDGSLLITPDEVKERIFHGGLDPSDGVRKEAWLFLLGVYEWTSTREERAAVISTRRDEYVRLKGAWWEKMVEGHPDVAAADYWKDQKQRIEKDVHRTDRHIALFEGEDIPHPDPDSPFADVGTNVHLEQMKDMLLTYNEYNTELGYVQGMSDLLAPIYAVMQDDAIAFWGFVGFMDRMERNFLRDQSGMRTQLLTFDHLVQLLDPALYSHLASADSTNFFFFFRMLLVWFKREFEWSDTLLLWETLWTDYLSSNYHLFIAMAILEKHRDVIMAHLKHFDEVLKYINELSGTIDLKETLLRAEALFKRFVRTAEAIDRKASFPAPTLKTTPESTGKGKGPAASSTQSSSAPSTKVISPELRQLLSRKVFKLDKQAVIKHGGGVA